MRVASVCALLALLACAHAATAAAAALADPYASHPNPELMECGLQVWCDADAPCLAGQKDAAMVTFDLSALRINASGNASDYSTSDATQTYFANVCAPSMRKCPSHDQVPLGIVNYGVALETANPALCYPVAHDQSPVGWTLVNPTDARAGVQIRYINGEFADCINGPQNPRQVNYVFTCDPSRTATPAPTATATAAGANPFVKAEMWPGNSCNYTYYFSHAAACPSIVYYPGPSHPAAGGLSGGSIFLITLLVVLVVYFLASVGLNYKRGARTWGELRPHPAAWGGLVGLVKDGCAFTRAELLERCRRCRGSGASAESDADAYRDVDAATDPEALGGYQSSSNARDVPEPATNFVSHFASDRDDIGGHTPLSSPRQIDHSYEVFPSSGSDVGLDEHAAGTAKKSKKKGRK